jgi:serine/threonine protein kinase
MDLVWHESCVGQDMMAGLFSHSSSAFLFLLLISFRTDVWALGSCLYQLAFLQNCFEEGSNLAILSRKYTIPEDNPYGEGLVELLDRMLTVDSKARADMTEVILCLSAVYSGRPLPPRKRSSKSKTDKDEAKAEETVGTYKTDGQGNNQEMVYDPTKATVAKKLQSNSVAARRKRAAAQSSKPPTAPSSTAPVPAAAADPLDFSSFNESAEDGEAGGTDAFGAATFGEMTGKKRASLLCSSL